MEGSAKQKVPGGKLLIIKLWYSQKIERIQILGDFFAYPESAIENIENALSGISKDSSEEEIVERIMQIVKRDNVEMIGITPESIAQTIKIVTK